MEKTDSFIKYYFKFRLDNFEHPDIADLIEESMDTDLARLLVLVGLCTKADDEGRLTYSDGKPYRLRHLARAMKTTQEKALKFLKRAWDLDLISLPISDPETDETGCNVTETFHETPCNVTETFHETQVKRDETFVKHDPLFHETWSEKTTQDLKDGNLVIQLVRWDHWYGMERPKKSTERVRRYRAKQRNDKDSAPKKTRKKKASKKVKQGETFHETHGNVSVTFHETHEKQNKTKQNKTNKKQTTTCSDVVVFEEKSFLRAAERAHQILCNSPLPQTSHEFTLRYARDLPDTKHGWKDREGAIVLAAQATAHAIENGKSLENPWAWMLTTLASHLPQAQSYNTVMEKKGTQVEYRWTPPERLAK